MMLPGYELAFPLPADPLKAAALSLLFAMSTLDLVDLDDALNEVDVAGLVRCPSNYIEQDACLTKRGLFCTLERAGCFYEEDGAFDDVTAPSGTAEPLASELRAMVDRASQVWDDHFRRFAAAYEHPRQKEVDAAFAVQTVSEAYNSFDPEKDKRAADHLVLFREGGNLIYRFPDLRLKRGEVEQFLEEAVEPHGMGLPNYFYRACKP